MLDRQALWEKFRDFLDSHPDFPDYLDAEPETIEPFDPYAMVSEWIALRHEVKQQGKLLQSSQNSLKQALTELQAEKTREQESRETRIQSEQKTFFRELLTVVDALDRASAYCQEQLDSLSALQDGEIPGRSPSFLDRLCQLWNPPPAEPENDTAPTVDAWRESLAGQQQGIDLIRSSLLDLLRQRQVIPLPALGQPFDSRTMYAVGREASDSLQENTVSREIVRGYLWEDKVLREARVIVATKTP